MDTLPQIEIFAIGTELALGRILDTNTHWMASQIARLGGILRRASILRDDLEEIQSALQEAIERGSRIVIVCGGLGPTPDDVTVEAIARLVGTSPIVDETILQEHLRRRNLKRREEATSGMLKMATVPQGAEVYPNVAGWAPCFKVAWRSSVIFALPGPPREMEANFRAYIEPYLSQVYPTKTLALRAYVAMYESEVSPLMQEVMERYPGTYLKAYVALRSQDSRGMPVDLVATASSKEKAIVLLAQAKDFFADLVRARGREIWFEGAEGEGSVLERNAS